MTSGASDELEGHDQSTAISMEQVEALLPLTIFDQVQRGRPFGPEAQVRMAHDYPGAGALVGKTLPQMLQDRKLLWAKSQPWVEGLSRLFDSMQEELSFQLEQLGLEGTRADAALAELSPFEKIAFKCLSEPRSPQRGRSRHGHELLLALVRELDQKSIGLYAELTDLAVQQLRSLRKKGHVLTNWEQAYLSQARTSLENAKTYSILRTVTHAIRNVSDRPQPGSDEIIEEPQNGKNAAIFGCVYVRI